MRYNKVYNEDLELENNILVTHPAHGYLNFLISAQCMLFLFLSDAFGCPFVSSYDVSIYLSSTLILLST